MRVALMTIGTRGDVQPFGTLAKGLIGSGHEATVVSSNPFAELAAEQGFRSGR
jgi:sterol 3beta-glucosyltransferase